MSGKNTCVCLKNSWSISFSHFCFYTLCHNFPLLHFLGEEPYSSSLYFVWREHSSSLLAFNRDLDVNGLGNPTLLHLFSHIEFIKQQMARDNVQFVRFESIDLHGVSRSKNVPSRFFQVSFLVSSLCVFLLTFMCFHAPILKLYFLYCAGSNSNLEQIICSLPLLMFPKDLDFFHHCNHLFLFSSK